MNQGRLMPGNALTRKLPGVFTTGGGIAIGAVVGATATRHVRTATVATIASVVFLPVLFGLPFGFLSVFAGLLYQREVRLGPWLTSPNDIVLFVSAALLLPRARLHRLSRSTKVGFTALVLGGGLAVPFAASPRIAAWGAARWLAAGIIAAAAFDVLSRRGHGARLVADALLGLGAVTSLLAVAQRLGVTFFIHGAYTQGRYNSVFGYYTDFAGFAAVAVIIGIARLSAASRERSPGPLIVIGTALSGVGLLLSLSRGGVLSVAAGLFFLVLVKLGDIRHLARLALVGVAVAGAVLFVVPQATVSSLVARVDNHSLSAGSDTERFNLQQIGANTLVNHPMGLGYGNFSGWLERQYGAQSGLFTTVLFHCHQLFIQIGLDDGWIGLSGFLVLLASSTGVAVRRRRDAVESLPLAAALVGFAAQGLFDYVLFETGMVACVVALLLGLEFAKARTLGATQSTEVSTGAEFRVRSSR